ncbi:MAG: flagellar motor protein MotB [Planctomycetota bacterium]
MPIDDSGPAPAKWIVTFTDLMSLLLTFFILLLTFSTPKVEKLFELRGSIRGTFGIFADYRDELDSVVPPSPQRIGRDQRNPFAPARRPRFRPLESHEPNAELLQLRDQSGEQLLVDAIDEGWRIRIADAITYEPAAELMDAQSYSRLATVAKAVEFMPYHLVVVSYVGGAELQLVRDRGWDPMDLATMRAVLVANRLSERHGIDPGILAVAGYGPPPGDRGPGRVEFILTRRTRVMESR